VKLTYLIADSNANGKDLAADTIDSMSESLLKEIYVAQGRYLSSFGFFNDLQRDILSVFGLQEDASCQRMVQI
jgi:hypothetical protein